MLQMGLVGLGAMGMNHYRILRELPTVELAAVCDQAIVPPHDEVPHYRSVEAMLAETSLDAAVIALPTSEHREAALSCIDAGLHILIEKPIAASAEEGRQILKAAEAAGILAAVGHIERFNPVVEALVKELEGRHIFSIAITRVGPFPPRIRDVGILVDLSVHDIDLIHHLTGGIEILESRIFKSYQHRSSYEDNAVIAFLLENEIVASVVTNWFTPFKRRRIEVATDLAFYEADLVSQDLTAYSSYERDGSFVVRRCGVKKAEPLKSELGAFAEYVTTGFNRGLASLEDGIRTLELIERRRLNPV